MGELNKKVAVITGCRRGFGEVIACTFAREGAAVSICDIVSREELKNSVGSKIEAHGGRVLCFRADVSKENEVRAMMEQTLDALGTVDILVNNVGIAGPTKDCWQISLKEWNRTLSINLGGAFLFTKHTVPEMIRKRYGRIINIGSIAGKWPLPHRTPYVTSKMGLIGFTRTLAAEVGKYNITVNTICPSGPPGERQLELAGDMAKYLGKHFDADDARKKMMEYASNPKAVLGGNFLREEGFFPIAITHEDVAHMALFLVSEAASKITGQDINVDGGTVMW